MNKGTLSKRVRLAKGRDVYGAGGKDFPKNVGDDALAQVLFLSDLDECMYRDVIDRLSESGASSDDVRELAREVHRGKTVEAKRDRIDKFFASERIVARRAESKNGTVAVRRTRSPREVLSRGLTMLLGCVSVHPDALRPVGDEYKDNRDKYLSIRRRLDVIFHVKGKGE